MSILDLKVERRVVAELHPHPLSHRVFGQLPPAQFEELKLDISRRGIQHPPEIARGMVIAGSQRLRALTALKVHTVTVLVHEELTTDEEIEEYLLLDNVQRRQLSPGQMYRAGKELERIESVKARRREHAGRKAPAGEKGSTPDHVAKKLGTSGDTYARLKKIYEQGSVELQDQVDAGTISIRAAAGKVKARTGQVRKLPGDDRRTHALRWARLQHLGNQMGKFLEDHTLDDLGGHREEATEFARALSVQLTEFVKHDLTS